MATKTKPKLTKARRLRSLHTAKFLGKSFNVIIGRMNIKDKLGGCTSRRAKYRALFLDERLEGNQLFATALHEALHACFDQDMPERKVEQAAKDITRFMTRLNEHRAKHDHETYSPT